MRDSLSIVLPVHNAQATLRGGVERILEVIPQVVSPLELLIVDDASQDATDEVAWELATQYIQVDHVRHPFPLGLAESVRTGLEISRGDYVLIHDGASPVDAEQMAHLWNDRVALLAGAPLSCANFAWQANDYAEPGWLRRLVTWVTAIPTADDGREARQGLQLIRRSGASPLHLDRRAAGRVPLVRGNASSWPQPTTPAHRSHRVDPGNPGGPGAARPVPASLHPALDRLKQRADGQ